MIYLLLIALLAAAVAVRHKRLVILLGLALLGVFLASPALADDGGFTDPSGPVVMDDTLASLRLSALMVMTIVSTLIPVLIGIVTKYASKWKGLATIVANAVAGLIVGAQMTDGSAIISQQALGLAALGLVESVAMYLTLWKPLGVTSSAVQKNDGTTVPGKLSGGGIL